jgi:Ni,Fe-hydrogenase III large subunit
MTQFKTHLNLEAHTIASNLEPSGTIRDQPDVLSRAIVRARNQHVSYEAILQPQIEHGLFKTVGLHDN